MESRVRQLSLHIRGITEEIQTLVGLMGNPKLPHSKKRSYQIQLSQKKSQLKAFIGKLSNLLDGTLTIATYQIYNKGEIVKFSKYFIGSIKDVETYLEISSQLVGATYEILDIREIDTKNTLKIL